ncbi:hypothetical protein QCD60_23095 [Pokkaliibacter sp. MBI-7]|uniref:SMP-30/gluconolactonase/LRE family protein n=1 Tax=Pokkaliibacter sp. MBI-7 TaxID=3040600 RepID=UPI002447D5B5|nr:hypothetical protein [Pokkaliibacter sp. MBI-7]MDH2435414.1 hypothetical protein [Pokkaliibacter sp. MBI-7]
MKGHLVLVRTDGVIWKRCRKSVVHFPHGDSDRIRANKPGQSVPSFLEGPSFDRQGYLYVTDIPYGRIFRISPQRDWQLIAEYDGWPNGLKIHKDGRIFIADYKNGILLLDPDTKKISPVLTHRRSEGFKGVLLADMPFAGKQLYSHR